MSILFICLFIYLTTLNWSYEIYQICCSSVCLYGKCVTYAKRADRQSISCFLRTTWCTDVSCIWGPVVLFGVSRLNDFLGKCCRSLQQSGAQPVVFLCAHFLCRCVQFCETTVPGSNHFSWGNVISAVRILWSKLSSDYNSWLGFMHPWCALAVHIISTGNYISHVCFQFHLSQW